MSTYVYIDGFNFYYGAVKGTSWKWLDLQGFARSLLRGHSIGPVRYFTARVDDRPNDLQQSQRQDIYLHALEATGVQVYEGHFRTHKDMVRLVKPLADGTAFVRAFVTEEKGSDVNLASHLVWDAAHRADTGMDCAMVVANDSDFQTPVNMAIALGVQVIVVNPHENKRQAHHLHGSDRRKLHKKHLAKNQLPITVTDSDGRAWTRPASWA